MARVVNHYVNTHSLSELNIETSNPSASLMQRRTLLEFAVDYLGRNNMKTSPIAKVDGYFKQREMIDDIASIASVGSVRAILEKAGVSFHLRPIHGENETMLAPLTSEHGPRVLSQGGRDERDEHQGLDFGQMRLIDDTRFATEVRASMTGRVRAWGYHPQFGNFVMLEHPGGSATIYGHLKEYPLNFRHGANFEKQRDFLSGISNTEALPIFKAVDVEDTAGHKQYFVDTGSYENLSQKIPAGTILGTMGDSGTDAKGNSVPVHLHFGFARSYNIDSLLKGRINADWVVPVFVYTSEYAKTVQLLTSLTPGAGAAILR